MASIFPGSRTSSTKTGAPSGKVKTTIGNLYNNSKNAIQTSVGSLFDVINETRTNLTSMLSGAINNNPNIASLTGINAVANNNVVTATLTLNIQILNSKLDIIITILKAKLNNNSIRLPLYVFTVNNNNNSKIVNNTQNKLASALSNFMNTMSLGAQMINTLKLSVVSKLLVKSLDELQKVIDSSNNVLESASNLSDKAKKANEYFDNINELTSKNGSINGMLLNLTALEFIDLLSSAGKVLLNIGLTIGIIGLVFILAANTVNTPLKIMSLIIFASITLFFVSILTTIISALSIFMKASAIDSLKSFGFFVSTLALTLIVAPSLIKLFGVSYGEIIMFGIILSLFTALISLALIPLIMISAAAKAIAAATLLITDLALILVIGPGLINLFGLSYGDIFIFAWHLVWFNVLISLSLLPLIFLSASFETIKAATYAIATLALVMIIGPGLIRLFGLSYGDIFIFAWHLFWFNALISLSLLPLIFLSASFMTILEVGKLIAIIAGALVLGPIILKIANISYAEVLLFGAILVGFFWLVAKGIRMLTRNVYKSSAVIMAVTGLIVVLAMSMVLGPIILKSFGISIIDSIIFAVTIGLFLFALGFGISILNKFSKDLDQSVLNMVKLIGVMALFCITVMLAAYAVLMVDETLSNVENGWAVFGFIIGVVAMIAAIGYAGFALGSTGIVFAGLGFIALACTIAIGTMLGVALVIDYMVEVINKANQVDNLFVTVLSVLGSFIVFVLGLAALGWTLGFSLPGLIFLSTMLIPVSLALSAVDKLVNIITKVTRDEKFNKENFDKAATAISDGFKTFITKLGEGASNIGISSVIALNLISDAINPIMNGVSKFVDAVIKVAIGQITYKDSKGNDKVITFTNALFSDSAKAISEGFGIFLTELGNNGKSLNALSWRARAALEDAVVPTMNALSNFVDAVVKGVEIAPEKFSGSATSIMGGFEIFLTTLIKLLNTLRGMDEDIIEAFGESISPVLSSLSSFVDAIDKAKNIDSKTMSETGSNIGSGLSLFVKNIVDNLYKKTDNLGWFGYKTYSECFKSIADDLNGLNSFTKLLLSFQENIVKLKYNKEELTTIGTNAGTAILSFIDLIFIKTNGLDVKINAINKVFKNALNVTNSVDKFIQSIKSIDTSDIDKQLQLLNSMNSYQDNSSFVTSINTIDINKVDKTLALIKEIRNLSNNLNPINKLINDIVNKLNEALANITNQILQSMMVIEQADKLNKNRKEAITNQINQIKELFNLSILLEISNVQNSAGLSYSSIASGDGSSIGNGMIGDGDYEAFVASLISKLQNTTLKVMTT